MRNELGRPVCEWIYVLFFTATPTPRGTQCPTARRGRPRCPFGCRVFLVSRCAGFFPPSLHACVPVASKFETERNGSIIKNVQNINTFGQIYRRASVPLPPALNHFPFGARRAGWTCLFQARVRTAINFSSPGLHAKRNLFCMQPKIHETQHKKMCSQIVSV